MVRATDMNRRQILFGTVAISFARSVGAQSKLPLVAILSPTSREAPGSDSVYKSFTEALAMLGYRHGQTIEIAERFANRDESRLPLLASELVALQPQVIFTNTSAAAEVVASATRSIPIVVGPAGEFVLKKLAGGSLARPTTNVTGIALTSPDIDNKAIALLLEAVPKARRIGVLVNPRNPGTSNYPAPQVAALGRPDLTFIRLEATGPRDIDAAMRRAAEQRIDVIFVQDDSHIAANPVVREHTLASAASLRIPIASSHQDYARSGALIALGPSIPALAARGANYVAKILEGARPADLPIELPSVLTLVLNLKTARSLGITIPPSLLTRTDELIQ
jgi:putative ABC transport system substrate-binding protein